MLCGAICMATEQFHLPAQAQTQEITTLDDTNAGLFLPGSYEQYLELNTPTDAAFSDEYIAIADGNTLYTCKRNANEPYAAYTCSMENATITKIQFVESTLYFTVRGTYNSFWKYDCTTQTAEQIPSLNCSTFLIVNGMLYTAVISGSQMTIAQRNLSDLQGEGSYLGTLSTGTEPWLAYAGGTLYCTVNDQVYYPGADGKFNDERSFYVSNDTNVNRHISSLCSDGTYLYFSSATGLFRRETGSSSVPELLSDKTQFCRLTALSYHAGSWYCIRGKSIREIDISNATATFTDYEITSSSDSVNRLNGATDVARAGNLIVTADAGNRRITVYQRDEDSYDALSCTEIPKYVSTDGEIIAYAAGTQVYVCNYAAGEREFSSAMLIGTEVVGISALYGSVYYVKGNGTRGIVGGISVETSTSPTGLTSDLYGNLYLLFANGVVRSYTEDEFLSASTGRETDVTLPLDATSLRADYEGNIYCLSDNALFCNGKEFARIDGADFVYGASATNAVSYALGFEDEAVYFLFGNYIVKSDEGDLAAQGALSRIPTLSEIFVGDTREATFTHHTPMGTVVDVAERSVAIAIDLTELRNSQSATFPYLRYERKDAALQGILLADASNNEKGYALVLLPLEDGSYTAALYRPEELTPVKQVWTEQEGTYFLSTQVSAYFAPCLDAALSETPLSRGTPVTLLGTIDAPDRTYALVEYGTDETARGWIPLSYLTSISPTPQDGETYLLGYLKQSSGIVFTQKNGDELTITDRAQVRLYDNGDGTYTAQLVDNPAYSAIVTENDLEHDSAETVRIALIIILVVLALLVLGMYIFLRSRRNYNRKVR